MDQIPLLEKENGEYARDEEENENTIMSYFQGLMGKKEIVDEQKEKAIMKTLEVVPRVVSQEDMARLEEPLSLQEIQQAIKEQKRGEAPGVDGVGAEFYLLFQEKIASLFLQVWEESLQKGSLPRMLNQGITKLIHKKGSKKVLKNWRPITMLTTGYKILATTIVNKMKSRLPGWVERSKKVSSQEDTYKRLSIAFGRE
ncbi:hypothetical protein O6H91_18G076300 [Diphasiastrum complanatum]|uniref:Uncharacterized protein n=1 Tax=Diphasiastrum complanatum TaxID=34168 RepID=A0ACC2B3R7_DIPCM|nr:hypothetical protein O6H91_18G076300 [Diphasiastrum complanatum]